VSRATADVAGTEGFLQELFRLGAPAASVEIEREARQLAGDLVPGASFVPFAATIEDGSFSATGTARVGGTCVSSFEHVRFVLRASATSLSLERAVLANEPTDTHCL
jgi:hypothetical protein